MCGGFKNMKTNLMISIDCNLKKELQKNAIDKEENLTSLVTKLIKKHLAKENDAYTEDDTLYCRIDKELKKKFQVLAIRMGLTLKEAVELALTEFNLKHEKDEANG
jgi:predicted HicB family RNase H-like nuclease